MVLAGLTPREWEIAIVDDNLIGTRHEHIARAKDLFRAMAHLSVRHLGYFRKAFLNYAKRLTFTFHLLK